MDDRERRDRGGPESADLFNIHAMFSRVGQGGGISRALLARGLGLSRTTASNIVTRLLEAGLVAERETAIRGRGRPGITLDLATDRWFAVGAEYHSRHWAFVTTNLKGEIIRVGTAPVERDDPESFLDALTEGLRKASSTVPGELLPAFGIGAPGLVDCDHGIIIRADDLGWIDVRVRERVQETLGTPSFVINRNRGSGLAETRFGAGRGLHSLVYIGIGTGISAAFIADGVLLHGSRYSAGEIGHIHMDSSGPLCHCGKRGCLQVLASGTALVRTVRELVASGESSALADAESSPDRRSITGESVCEAAAGGDPVALESLRRAATWLGVAVANIVTSFNPDKVILGGPVGLAQGPFLDMVRAEAARWAMDYPLDAVSIERGMLGEYTGALGAACLVLDRKLSLALDAL